MLKSLYKYKPAKKGLEQGDGKPVIEAYISTSLAWDYRINAAISLFQLWTGVPAPVQFNVYYYRRMLPPITIL